jgi:hypothetical protein
MTAGTGGHFYVLIRFSKNWIFLQKPKAKKNDKILRTAIQLGFSTNLKKKQQ